MTAKDIMVLVLVGFLCLIALMLLGVIIYCLYKMVREKYERNKKIPELPDKKDDNIAR